MRHFKTPGGGLHSVPDDGSQDHTIGVDMAPISEAQFAAMSAFANPPVDSKALVKAQIVALEATQLLPRVTREFMLLYMATQYTPEQLVLNAGYVKLKAFDDQIKVLRGMLL